jgi:Glycosyl hydrolase family 26
VLAVIAAIVAASAVLFLVRHDRVRHHQAAGPRPSVSYRPPAGPLPPMTADSLIPARGALLGAWVKPTAGFTDSGQEAGILSFEHAVGRKLAINSLYTTWSDPMPAALASWDLRGGRVPMITWAGASSAVIASGADDAQIRAAALGLKAVGGPVLLRYFPEMDYSFQAKTAGTPAQYIAAWRHLHDIFASVGAANVHWVWCPSAIGFATGSAQRFYPGDSYVDWIGADGYNWAPELKGTTWRSFATIFSAFYQWGEHEAKPLLVGEFGAVEGKPGEKAEWLRQVGQELSAQFPRIKAIIYFNSIHENFGLQFDWKVTSSPSALAGFRALAMDPYLAARLGT